MYEGFAYITLDGSHGIYTGRFSDTLIPDDSEFKGLWQLHPKDYHEVVIHGRPVKTPRWQQAYGQDQ